MYDDEDDDEYAPGPEDTVGAWSSWVRIRPVTTVRFAELEDTAPAVQMDHPGYDRPIGT